MIKRNLTGSGFSGIATEAIAGTVNDGLTATGTTQATALLISGDLNVFSTVASGAGCILRDGDECDQYSIINNGVNALKVYPPVGGTIAGAAVNAAYTLAASTAIEFIFSAYLTVVVRPGSSASGGGGTVVIASGKTLTVDNTLEFAGTDGTVITFPTTSATIARTDAGNTFTGAQGFGSAPSAGFSLWNAKTITGATSAAGQINLGVIQSDVTSLASIFKAQSSTAAASFTLTDLRLFDTFQSTIGSGSVVTNQYGYYASSTLTGATNNYGFYGNIASAAGRYNLYMNGTAANFFAGDMQLGKTVTASGTTGAQTINKTSGSVNFAAAATSLVVTNSLCSTSSIIIATVATNDTTMTSVKAVAGSGSFTLFSNAAATAETRVNFLITN